MSLLERYNPFRFITKDKKEEKNIWVGLGRGSILNIHYHLPGALWTNFVHERGITPEMEGPYGIPSSFVIAPLATILVTPFIDRIQNRIRAYSWLTFLGTMTLFIPSFIFCLGPESFRSVKFILITQMLFGWWATVMNIARSGLDGAVACRVIHNSIRGRITSINGMVQGVVGIGVGIFVTWVAKCFSIQKALLLGSAVSCVTLLIGSWLTRFYEELPDLAGAPVIKKKGSFMKDLAKIVNMKEFKIMMPANVLRGLGDGVGAIIFWVALKRLELPPVYAGYVTIATVCAPFIGNLILGLTMDRFGAVIVIPASCAVIAACLMGTILTKSPLLFIIYLFVYWVARPVEASAIPLAHYVVVPNEVMGAFSTVRLGLLTITGSISAVLAQVLMRWFSPVTIFAGSAAIKLMAGTLYCLGLILLKKHKEATA